MEKYCPKCFKKYPPETERCAEDGSYLVTPMDRDLTGEVLDDRYTVIERIGRGGMGVVYKAEQYLIKRIVALKVLRREIVQDETAVKRFLNEARAIATLDNPHTVTLHDFGVTRDGLLYYTMELLKGCPLSRIIRDEAPMDHVRAADLILQACRSLDEAHEHGILHRDIKPDNLFVEKKAGSSTGMTAGREVLKVLDFGIAKLLGEKSGDSVTQTGMIIGTPQYLSPEQALGNPVVPASDLYSLAIVLYEMLAGRPPFLDETPMKTMWAHVRDPVPPLTTINPKVQVPRSIEAFLAKALEKDPGDRFRTAAEFAQALDQAVQEHAQQPMTVPLQPLSADQAGVRLRTQAMLQTGDAGMGPGTRRGTAPAGEPPREPTARFDSAVRAELDALKHGGQVANPESAARREATPAPNIRSSTAHRTGAGSPASTVNPELPVQGDRWTPGAAVMEETGHVRRPAARLWMVAGVVALLVLAAGALAILAFWKAGSPPAETAAERAVRQESGKGVGRSGPEAVETPAEPQPATPQAAASAVQPGSTESSASPPSSDLLNAEAQARLKAEEDARRLAEELERTKAQAAAERLAEMEARLKVEENLRKLAEERVRLEAEVAAGKIAEAEARLKVEENARKLAEEEARLKSLAEREGKLNGKPRSAALKEADKEAPSKGGPALTANPPEVKVATDQRFDDKKKAEEEARLKAEALAWKKSQEEARLKAEADARKKAEEEARTLSTQARKKAEKEAEARAAQARKKAEEEARALSAQAKAEAEAEAVAKAEAQAIERAEREAREREEEEARLDAEAEALALKVEQLLNKAEAAAEDGKYDSCIKLLTEALKLDPGNSWATDTIKECKEKKELQDLKL
jgi:serine/threonine-protein kinase